MARLNVALRFVAMSAMRTVQSPLLVGRDEQLESADQWIADAAAGHGRFVLLAGEPGIGKTRLLGSIRLKARAAGFRSATGDIGAPDVLVLLAGIHDIARAMTSAEFGALGAELLAIDPTRSREPARPRRLIVRDLAELILDAVDRPTLLAFEDLQWADELTLEVIGELARGAADRSLLMVGTYRPDELPRGSIHREWRARLVTQRLAEEIRLGRLDPASDEWHPAAHRGIARGGRRLRRGRQGHPRRLRPRHDRGCGARPRGPAQPGGACSGAGGLGRRALLRPRHHRRHHGPTGGGSRRAARRARRGRDPVSVPVPRPGLLRFSAPAPA